MKVKELKKLLEQVNDEVDVVVPARDHNYRVADVHVTHAFKTSRKNYEEWYGDEDEQPEFVLLVE
jgi:hypothetical protein